MKLVNCEGSIYRMSKARLRAFIREIAAGRSPRLDDYGAYLGRALNVTDITPTEATEHLTEMARSISGR